jgi:hypothetical protein
VYVSPVVYVEVAAAYTFPAPSTPSPEFVSPVNHWLVTVRPVVEACSKTDVLEAKREKGLPVRRSAVLVADGVWPQKASCVHASYVERPVEAERHVLLIAKHPAWRLMPFPVKEEVAVPVTSSLRAVVEPVVALKARNEVVVVAKVVGDDVEKYRVLLMARRLNGAFVKEASVRASCGAVEEEIVRAHCGVEVPMPRAEVVAERKAPVCVHAS